MIPESRRAGWVNEDLVDSESDSDLYVSHELRSDWSRKRRNTKWAREDFLRFKKIGLTDIQAYVAAYHK